MSLTTFVKKVNGYKSLDMSDTTLQEITHKSEGFAKKLSGWEFNPDIIDKIYQWFSDKSNKCKVSLTTYYLSQGTGRKTCTLTNLV